MPAARSDLLASAVGVGLGVAADAVFADPRRGHPVAGFGRWASAVERRLYAPARGRGVLFVALTAGVPAALAGGVERGTAGRPWLRVAATGVATWAVLGGTSLRREADRLGRALAGNDLEAARRLLPNLCGRDPAGLDTGEICRAAVESVAENTSDAVVAPLVWAAVAGLPGLVGYRAVNTLDAMVGHRSARYAAFGWAAARVDDVANLAPARLTAVLTAAVAPAVGGSPALAWATWRRDGDAHPSPNAGQCEAAAAGALGVRLGGRNTYGGVVDERPVLGSGRAAGPGDVDRAARLSGAVGLAAAGVAVAVLLGRAAWAARGDWPARSGRAARTGRQGRRRPVLR